jgi:response regulator RpfG family c-di-GMP phosphodiesterase
MRANSRIDSTSRLSRFKYLWIRALNLSKISIRHGANGNREAILAAKSYKIKLKEARSWAVLLPPEATRLSSLFHLFPETDARISPLPRSASSPRMHLEGRVLIIEPESVLRQSLQLTLEAEGILAHSGSSFSEIGRMDECQTLSVIIVDLAALQDGSTGVEAILQSRCPSASIVALVSIFSLTSATQCVGNGAIFGFVTKPWLREELVSTVIAAAEAAKMRKAIASLRSDLTELQSKEAKLTLQLAALGNELSQASLALSSSQAKIKHQTDALPNLFNQLIGSRSRTLATRHRQLVAIARKFSESVSFNPEDGRKIILAAALCDLGLLGLEQSLLKKLHRPGASLSDEELRAYESHPILSTQLAAHLDADGGVREIIKSHHERFDGTGFPEGLSGESIPWLSRCLGVAVFLTEMQQPQSEALAAALSESGRLLDPEAVKLFCSAPKLLEDSSLFVRSQAPHEQAQEEDVQPSAQKASLIFNEFSPDQGYENLWRKMTPLKDPRSVVGQSLDVLG